MAYNPTPPIYNQPQFNTANDTPAGGYVGKPKPMTPTPQMPPTRQPQPRRAGYSGGVSAGWTYDPANYRRPRPIMQPGGGQMPIGVKPLPDPRVRTGPYYPDKGGSAIPPDYNINDFDPKPWDPNSGDPRGPRGRGGWVGMPYGDKGQGSWGEDSGFPGSGPIMRTPGGFHYGPDGGFYTNGGNPGDPRMINYGPGGKGGYQGGLEAWLIPDGNGGYRLPGPDENGGWMRRGNGQGPQVDMGDNRLMPHPGGMTSFNDGGQKVGGGQVFGGGPSGRGPNEAPINTYGAPVQRNLGGMQQPGQGQGPQQGQVGGGRAPLRPGMQYRPGGGQRPMGGRPGGGRTGQGNPNLQQGHDALYADQSIDNDTKMTISRAMDSGNPQAAAEALFNSNMPHEQKLRLAQMYGFAGAGGGVQGAPQDNGQNQAPQQRGWQGNARNGSGYYGAF